MDKNNGLKILSTIVFYFLIAVLIFYLVSPFLSNFDYLYNDFKIRRYLGITLIILLLIKLAKTKFKPITNLNVYNTSFLILSSIVTFITINYFNVYSILVVALISLAGGFFIPEFGGVITIGAFLGSSVNMNFYNLSIALIFACLISESLKDSFNGIGGKLGTISFVSVFLSYLILKTPFDTASFYTINEILIILLVTIVSSITTLYINNNLKKGPIVSYSLVALAGVMFFKYIFKTNLDLAPIVYGASFIGMTKASNKKDYLVILLASFIFTLILFINVVFKGPGGLFGTTALISVLISKLVHSFLFKKSDEYSMINIQ